MSIVPNRGGPGIHFRELSVPVITEFANVILVRGLIWVVKRAGYHGNVFVLDCLELVKHSFTNEYCAGRGLAWNDC